MAEQEPESVDVARMMPEVIEMFATFAWQKMGLRSDPMTGKTEKDLDQAKLSIDAASALADLIDSKLDGEDKRKLRNLMTDLRLNYVQQKEMAAPAPE